MSVEEIRALPEGAPFVYTLEEDLHCKRELYAGDELTIVRQYEEHPTRMNAYEVGGSIVIAQRLSGFPVLGALVGFRRPIC